MTMDDFESEDSSRPDFRSRDSVLRHHDASAGSSGLPRGDSTASRAVQGEKIDLVVGIESRGFIFRLDCGRSHRRRFFADQEGGKLPSSCVRANL